MAYAAVYEKERKLIAARSKAALAAKRARGEKHGQPRDHMLEISKQGVSTLMTKADRFAIEMAPIIDGIFKSGITDNANIAEALNRRGVRTARGEGEVAQRLGSTTAVTRRTARARVVCRTVPHR